MTESIIVVIAFVAAGAYIGFRAWKSRDKSPSIWVVPFSIFDGLLVAAERRMIEYGFSKGDYVYGSHDCTNYAKKWREVLREELSPYLPKGKTASIRRYSFQRDLRLDGSTPGRHQVVVVRTDAGKKVIDTYRINGTLYRELSDTEWNRGYYLDQY